jgi:hypothetical protein
MAACTAEVSDVIYGLNPSISVVVVVIYQP